MRMSHPQRSDGVLDKGPATLLGREIDCDGNGFYTELAQLGCGLINTLATAGANGHITTFLGKRFRDRKTNALASARDQRIFVLETEIQLSPRCSYLLISACESTSPGKARPHPQTEATWLGLVSHLPKS